MATITKHKELNGLASNLEIGVAAVFATYVKTLENLLATKTPTEFEFIKAMLTNCFFGMLTDLFGELGDTTDRITAIGIADDTFFGFNQFSSKGIFSGQEIVSFEVLKFNRAQEIFKNQGKLEIWQQFCQVVQKIYQTESK